ncbi:hypothetical protein RRG08_003853 [Elysia crispata]|uniref:Uncharacterized protein n=1 Tax=Elysia crispata TaxID=231223 RepID=A0AAE0ZFV8_9GAST|nr:hypothetical protein RRG08_003853 [Elysia crispata]
MEHKSSFHFSASFHGTKTSARLSRNQASLRFCPPPFNPILELTRQNAWVQTKADYWPSQTLPCSVFTQGTNPTATATFRPDNN